MLARYAMGGRRLQEARQALSGADPIADAVARPRNLAMAPLVREPTNAPWRVSNPCPRKLVHITGTRAAMADLKLAFRTLAKTPFITGVAILSLALGIGANAGIFSLFNQMILASLPVRDAGRLVNLGAPGPKPGSQSCGMAGDCDQVFSYPMFRDLQSQQTTLAGIAAHRSFTANLALADQTVDGQGALVSGSYFDVLGLRPALGRLLTPADDEKVGANFVAVLSYRFWENRFGADPAVLNQTIQINGNAMTVVGVAPRGFDGTTLGRQPDVFVPLTMRREIEPAFANMAGFENRRVYYAYLFGRLKSGVSIEQARADLGRIYHNIITEVEAPLQDGMSEQGMERFLAKQITVEPGRRGQSSIHSDTRTPLLLLLGITGIVLLIACANIANLLLARGAARAQEMAVRGSLGATRRQLLRQLMTESLLLAIFGGLASLLVARATLLLIGWLLPPEAIPGIELRISGSVALFAAALTMGTGLLFGLFPALHATRHDLAGALRAMAGQQGGARAAARFRAGLVTGQIALSMALMVAAGLFIRSLMNVSRVDLGMTTEGVVTFSIAPALNGYEPERSRTLFARTEEELAAIPGVRSVSGAMVPILAGSSWGNSVSVEGFEGGPDIDSGARFNEVGPGYFNTLGVPLIGGREFNAANAADRAPVAIVNEAFARKFGLEPREAVGKWMATGSGPEVELDMQVVGVVQDAKYNDVKQEVPPVYFTPYRQDDRLGFLTFYLSTSGDPAPVLRAVPGVMKRIDPTLPVEELKTLQQQVAENTFGDRAIGTLAAAFALLATLLAAVGLYGVLAYTVTQRTREIGLRMALGAHSGRVRRMILSQVTWMFGIGGVLGLLGALALGKAAASLLFGLSGTDIPVMLAAVAVLALVAFGAGFLPALRASRVDPMQALRYE